MARINNGVIETPYTGKAYMSELGSKRSYWYDTIQEAVNALGGDWDTIYIKRYEDGIEQHGSLRSVNNHDQSLWEIE